MGAQGDGIMGETPEDISKSGRYVNSPEAGKESRLLNPDTELVADVSVLVKQEVKGTGTVEGRRGISTGYEGRGGG
jgi:hypothetical protein